MEDEIPSSLDPPIPVPTHGPGGTFSIKVTAHIRSPPQTVISAVRDTSTWPTWNIFCPKAIISPDSPSQSQILEVGSIATIQVFMDGNGQGKERDQGIEVTKVDEEFEGEGGKRGCRIAWKATGYSHWQLRSERVMEFWDDGKGGTDYVCWETFGGVLGRVVKGMVGGQLVERFRDYARDLKGFVEGNGVNDEVEISKV